MTAPEWLHYALYPGDGARLDRVVREVVAPAVARAGVAGPPRRWFFLRFTDELGPHVRLRFAGGQGAVDAIHQAVDPALRRALREVTAPPRERTPPGITGCHQGFYEPELDRYGGRAGVALAEAVFEVSSEVTLALLGRADVAARRRALALTLMRRAARSTLREADLPAACGRATSGTGRVAPARPPPPAAPATRSWPGPAPPEPGNGWPRWPRTPPWAGCWRPTPARCRSTAIGSRPARWPITCT